MQVLLLCSCSHPLGLAGSAATREAGTPRSTRTDYFYCTGPTKGAQHMKEWTNLRQWLTTQADKPRPQLTQCS
jgi:hypothetical protein